MKNKSVVILLAFIVLFSMSGCSSEKNVESGDENSVKPLEKIFELDAYPVCDGSVLTLPLSEAICSTLTDTPIKDVYKRVLHNGKANALSNLFNGYTQIVFVEGTEDELNKKAEKVGVDIEIYPIAQDYYVFYKDSDKMDEDEFEYDLSLKDAQRIIEGNSEYDIKCGKGYFFSGYLPDNIKIYSVNGKMPSAESVKSGDYPFTFNYYAVIRADSSKDSGERKVIESLQSEAGQLLVEEEGYVKI